MLRPNVRAEQQLWKSGYPVVAGVDEAGRGAWAGPIVAGAVALSEQVLKIIRRQAWFRLVADSKLLAPKLREEIFCAAAPMIPWAVGVVNNRVIDKIGIADANRRAVQLAIMNLGRAPNFILVDYVAKLANMLGGVPVRTVVDGDAHIFSIALASIIAKVQRDRLMYQYSIQYPGYGFGNHKGYGTLAHQQTLLSLGPCALHRRSYRPVAACLV